MKTDGGYVPYSSGEEFRLGDFGYFKGSVWCRMGNLKDVLMSEPQTETRDAGLYSRLTKDVSVDCGGGIVVDAANQHAESIIKFNSKHSFFQKANIDSHLIYPSIPEIETILKELLQNGKWRLEYHLIVNVVKAKSFLTVISNSKTAEVKLNVDLKDDEILAENLKMGVDIGLKVNSGDVLVVKKKDEGNKYACAAKFVCLKRTSFFSKDLRAQYSQDAESLRTGNRMESGVCLAFSEDVDEGVAL